MNARSAPRAAALTAAALIAVAPAATADPERRDLQPGVPIFVVNNDTQMLSECTLGWFMVASTGTVQAMTAGHCHTGPDIQVRDPATGERVTAGSWGRALYTGDLSVLSGTDIATVTLSPDRGRSAMPRHGAVPVGVSSAQDLAESPPSVICKQGSTTGVSCGRMVSVSDERVAFRAKVDRGDSGGPVWAISRSGEVTAVAIAVGQSDDDPSVAVGQLINPWLIRWGATLAVPRS